MHNNLIKWFMKVGKGYSIRLIKLAIDQRESKAEHTEHFKLISYSSVPCFYLFISFIIYK